MSDAELRELDARVSVTVFGVEPCRCWFSINSGPNGECEKCGKVPAPPYSTSIEVAWRVVEKMAERFWIEIHCAGGKRKDGDRIEVSLYEDFWEQEHPSVVKEADTAPLAICLAALAAAEGGKG